MKGKDRRWKIVAVLALGMAIGVSMTATPAASHVAGWVHNWNRHIKPRADARYYRKALADARYYNVTETVSNATNAANAGALDGLDSTQVRSAVASALGTSFNDVGTTEEDIASITVNVPANGTLLVTMQAEWNNGTANTYLNNRLYEGATELEFWDSDSGDADGFYDQQQSHTVVLSVAPGAHAYTWRASTSSGTATNWQPEIIAVFIPGSLAASPRAVAPRVARPNAD